MALTTKQTLNLINELYTDAEAKAALISVFIGGSSVYAAEAAYNQPLGTLYAKANRVKKQKALIERILSN